MQFNVIKSINCVVLMVIVVSMFAVTIDAHCVDVGGTCRHECTKAEYPVADLFCPGFQGCCILDVKYLVVE